MPTAERPPLRTHQRRALEALDEAWAGGRTRAWTVLPPGAGKTRVGLETAERLLAAGQVERAVVLGPNTAIVGQWEEQAADLGIAMGTGIVAAIMVSADLGRRITGFAFIVFAVSSTCWVMIGLSDDEAPLMYQNIVLTVINFIGIYRWLILKKESG